MDMDESVPGQGNSENLSADIVERLVADAVDRRMKSEAAMRRRRSVRAWSVASVAVVLVTAAAAIATNPPVAGEVVPRQIPYRGILDLNGAPVPSGSLPMLFEIFNAQQQGDKLWSDSMSVSVQDGQFSVALGDNPLNPIPTPVFAQPSLYLQMTVNGQLLAGRQRLLSVPYAQFAGASSAVPVGSVLTWLSNSIPDGWHVCDGAAIPDDLAHARIRSIVGNNYPDLRGNFLRGVDSSRAVLTWQGFSTAMPGNRFTTTTASFSHSHTIRDGYNMNYGCGVGASVTRGVSNSADDWNQQICERDGVTNALNWDHDHEISGGDAETRPVNVAVHWIIKDCD